MISVDKKEEKSVNIVDLFMYLAFYWKWFLVSVLLFVGYFGYDYYRTPFVYSRSATVMIKTPANSQGSLRITRSSSYIPSSVSVTSEILQFKTRELMRKAVNRLHANVSYTVIDGLRDHELYADAPLQVQFLDSTRLFTRSFSMKRVDNSKMELFDFSTDEGQTMTAQLNDTINTPVGRIIIKESGGSVINVHGKTMKVCYNDVEQSVNYFLSNLSVKQMEEDADLISLTLNDFSLHRAGDILNMLVVVYNEQNIEDKNQVAVNTAQFIESRLAIIEQELGSVETNIEQLKNENEGLDIETATGFYIADNRQYKESVKGLDMQLQLAWLMKNHLKESLNKGDLIPNNTGLVDQNLETQIEKYNGLLIRRKRLTEGNGNNPVIGELTRSIYTLRTNIITAVDNLIAGLQLQKKSSYTNEAQTRGKIRAVPDKQRRALSVERQQKVKEALYLFLLNKREENALNQAMTEESARMIDLPYGSERPLYPSRLKKIMLGVGTGIAFPAVVLLLILTLDTRVRSRKDLEEGTNIPFLGEVPLKVEKNIGTSDILKRMQQHDNLSEAFRILRTNIGFMTTEGRESKVIMLTSFSAGAGKTFNSLNLAASFALAGKKVVVVDLDLRKGSLSKLLGIKAEIGVTHYLSDTSIVIDSIVNKYLHDGNLKIIPVGAIAPNPAELLLSKRLDELIYELRKQYDYVMIDGVPVGLVADTTIVNRVADLCLFVVRAGKIDRRLLPELEKMYKERKLNNMALVLNGVSWSKNSHYGYGYSYGYGYGYGYGYSHENKTKKMDALKSWLHYLKKIFR